MFNDRRKIQLIEDLLKVDNNATRKQVEIVIRKAVPPPKKSCKKLPPAKKVFMTLQGL